MDDTKIRNFLVVARTLSYTKAAEILYKSQSVISRQIAAMEDELGMQLFNRNTRGVTLTPQGEVMARALKEIAEKYERALTDASAIKKGIVGVLNFGALTGQTAKKNFFGILNGFTNAYPKIKVNFETQDIARLKDMLSQNLLDGVFNSDPHFCVNEAPEIESMYTGISRNCLMIPVGHALAEKNPEEITLEDIEKATMYLLNGGEFSNLVPDFERFCIQSNIRPHVISVKSMGDLFIWMSKGDGITCMNEDCILFDNRNIKCVFLPGMGGIPEHIIWNNTNTNPCLKTFLDYAKSYLSTHRPETFIPTA